MPVEDSRMKTDTKDLASTLEKLTAIHRTLIGILQEEFAQMGTIDVNGLRETAHAKEVLLSQVWTLEQERIRQTALLSQSLGLVEQQPTISAISHTLENTEKEKLRNLGKILQLLVKQAKDLNSRNMTFVGKSLERIEQLKKNMLGTGTSSDNYSNSGVRQPVTEQGGRLLSTEA